MTASLRVKCFEMKWKNISLEKY